MQRLFEYINGFSSINEEEFQVLATFIEVKKIDRKTVLTDLSQSEDYLYFVSTGLVRKYFLNKKDEIITQIAKEGEFISSSVSFLSRTPSHYILETLEPSSLLAISHDNIEKIYSIDSKMNKLGKLMILDWLLGKEEWEYERLTMDPKERFQHFVAQNTDLVKRVPQKYLASYLNIKPETFSRYKHLLK